MTEQNISQELILKKINEMNYYFNKEIDQYELLSNKKKKVCTTLNYFVNFLNLVFAATVCISFSGFASLMSSTE